MNGSASYCDCIVTKMRPKWLVAVRAVATYTSECLQLLLPGLSDLPCWIWDLYNYYHQGYQVSVIGYEMRLMQLLPSGVSNLPYQILDSNNYYHQGYQVSVIGYEAHVVTTIRGIKPPTSNIRFKQLLPAGLSRLPHLTWDSCNYYHQGYYQLQTWDSYSYFHQG